MTPHFDEKLLLHGLAAFGAMTGKQIKELLDISHHKFWYAMKKVGPTWVAAVCVAPREMGRPGRYEMIYALVREDHRLKITEKIYEHLRASGRKSRAELAVVMECGVSYISLHLRALREQKRVRVAEYRLVGPNWTGFYEVSNGEPDATIPIEGDEEHLFRHDPSLQQHIRREVGVRADHVDIARRKAEFGMWAGLAQ